MRDGAIAMALVSAAAMLVGCTPPPPDQEIEFRVPVFVREVGMGTVEDRIVATGTLRTAETIALRADTAGALIIARQQAGRRLAEGDQVTVGQTIAEITGEEVRLAARTESTLQRYETALQEYKSKQKLFDDGLISDQEFRQVATTLADAKIELEQSRLTESRSRLVTPIAGIILRLGRDEQGQPMADGQLVGQGYEVAQIAPIGSLVAEVDLVGPDVARVREGLKARVRHHAWTDDSFEGRVMRLAPTLDPMTRTLRAEVAVSNRDSRLRPGMFVEVTMVAERREDVPVVPREALAERGGRKVVFVLKGQRVDRRDVVAGLGDDDVVEIRQGLEAGERIVVRGLETLTDGTRVQVSGSSS
jgi:membrane fusion protein (multidrug efflux system)